MVHPFLQELLSRYYGDHRIIKDSLGISSRWMDSLEQDNASHIVNEGLGDHESLTEEVPAALVTPVYAHCARLLSDLSRAAGRNREAERYADLANRIREAYVTAFVDLATGRCGSGTQSAHVFALALDMLSEEVRQQTLELVTEDLSSGTGHLTTGIFGTGYLFEVLTQAGRADIAQAIVLRDDSPGYLHMLKSGATTLWESWGFSENTYSHNHPMFGSVSQWFFNCVAGIQPHPQAVGFDRILVQPQPVDGLDWVRASYDSVRGPVESGWRKDAGGIEFRITIPANTTATILLRSESLASVTEDTGQAGLAADAAGVFNARWESGQAVLEVGSGAYVFRTR
jgi:alpha-L-rhamnosidase